MARSSRFHRDGPKRQVTWIGPPDQNFLSVTSTAKTLVGSFDPAAAALIKPTVVRTRGNVAVKPTALNADVTIVGAFGLAVVSDQAFAAGAGSIPGPFDDAEWDGWFVWHSFSYTFEFADATGFQGPMDLNTEVDSKAMRKVTDNETIVLMAESQIGAFAIAMNIRLLLKLS